MGTLLGGRLPSVIDLKLPGFLGRGFVGGLLNGIVQGAAAGGVVFLGYVGSGYVVDAAEEMIPADSSLKGKYTRPVLFGLVAGVMGGVAAYLAPAKKKALWSILAASGSGIRAFGGFVGALIGADATGATAKLRSVAVGLADYIQVGEELYEGGLEGGGNTLEDYIQVGEEAYEAGLGEGEEEGTEDESTGEEEEVIIS